VNRRERRRRGLPALVICFYLGVAAGWLLHSGIEHSGIEPVGAKPSSPSAAVEPLPVPRPAPADDRPAATSGSDPRIAPVPARNPIEELRRRQLMLPIAEANIDAMEGDFVERRGQRVHEAVDILAPRNTPIRAVEAGTIARLFLSKLGGTTIYQFDQSKRFCYYYAHLERYAGNLQEGQSVAAGEVIGYVGTSGNAPPNTPHLHFAIFELTSDRRWWEGKPIDPYLIFR
jgi:murein DD-endopeptidase MepM/ murein hydrolase activator NlpD